MRRAERIDNRDQRSEVRGRERTELARRQSGGVGDQSVEGKAKNSGIVFYGKVELTEAWQLPYQMVFIEGSF